MWVVGRSHRSLPSLYDGAAFEILYLALFFPMNSTGGPLSLAEFFFFFFFFLFFPILGGDLRPFRYFAPGPSLFQSNPVLMTGSGSLSLRMTRAFYFF